MRHLVPALALLIAAAGAGASTPSRTPLVLHAPIVAADPVGAYNWSFDINGNQVTGTLAVAKVDSGYSATFTSNTQPGAMTSNNVTFAKDTLTAYINGDFGTFGVQVIFKGEKGEQIEGRYSLQTSQGQTGGALSIQRAKKPEL
jgi:hypothetical protein